MGIKVLSLFDGMSCGQIALQRGGIKVSQYFASEIHKPSIKVTQKNHPNTIQIGNVEKVSYKDGYLTYEDNDTKEMITLFVGKIHMVLAGSPCQDLSRSNTNGQGLEGVKSGLFYEFTRLLSEIKPKYFLLENVVMEEVWMDMISNDVGVYPILINSNLVSAQNRKRLYWTNIPNIMLPKDKEVMFSDIAYDGEHQPIKTELLERIRETKRLTSTGYYQYDKNGKGHNSQFDRLYFKTGKVGTLTTTCGSMKIIEDMDNENFRRIHIIEAERLQNVTEGYTEGVCPSYRFGMLGNGWTVDVITHIFSFMDLDYLYLSDEEMETEMA